MFRVARFLPSARAPRIIGLRFNSLQPQSPAVPQKIQPGSYNSHDHALCYDPFEFRDRRTFKGYQAFYRKHWHDLHGKIPLPDPWSCDWSRWEYGVPIQQDTADIKHAVSEYFGVTSPMRPMAFVAGGESLQVDQFILFEAGGEYYYWGSEELDGLMRFKERFSSHEDFLRRFEDHIDDGEEMPHQSRTDPDWYNW